MLALVYFKCKMLCPQVLRGMAASLKQTGFHPGHEYDIVVASIDPTDTPADAAEAKKEFLDQARARANRSSRSQHSLPHRPAGLDRRSRRRYRIPLRPRPRP